MDKKRISYNIFSIFEKGGCTCKGGFFVKEVLAILNTPPPLQLSPKNILPSSCMNYHRTLQLWMNTFNAIDTTRLEIVKRWVESLKNESELMIFFTHHNESSEKI